MACAPSPFPMCNNYTAFTPKACAISAPRCSPAGYFALLCRGVRRRLRHRHRAGWRERDRLGDEFLFPGRGDTVLWRWHVSRSAARGERLHVLGGDAPRRRSRLPFVRLRPQQARHRRVRLQKELGVRAGAPVLPLQARTRGVDSWTTTRSIRNTGCSSRVGNDCRFLSPMRSVHRSCAVWAERTCRICCSSRNGCLIRRTRAR